MNRLFGKKKPEAPAKTLDDASQSLEKRGTVIDAKIGKLDAELLKCREMIQKTRGPQQQRYKQRALQILQQKRSYEGHRNQVYNQQFAVDQLNFTTEMMRDTKTQVEAMKGAAKTLKADFKGFKVEDVEAMQDELIDLYEDVQEIQDIMGRAYGVQEEVDEDELQGELDALAFDMEKEKDTSYLDDALTTPGTRLPELAKPAGQTEVAQPATDPYALEAQLGL
jgi:charged multivesicular body protein 5